MGQFSKDLFLRLAKDVDNHNMLKGINYDNPAYGEGTFGAGQDQIDDFKDALFMVLMMRARQYMDSTRQEDLCPEKRHAYASFGITLIDSDVHEGENKLEENLVKKITGGIGLKTDTFYLDDKVLANCVRALFTGDSFPPNPIVRLACTNPT